MEEVIKALIGIGVLVLGYFIGNLLAVKTKEEIFHGKNTYGVIDVDSLEMRNNPEKQKYQDEAVRKYNQRLNDLYEMHRAKK